MESIVMSFIDRFTDSAEHNQSLWERCRDNPVIRYGAAWCRDFVAPSSLLVDGDTLVLYAEGGADDRECIGRYSTPARSAYAARWTPDSANPLLEPSGDGFDRGSVFDPAAIRFQDNIHLFYSATAKGAHAFAERADTSGGDTPDDETIGHAVESEDGLRRTSAPVMVGRCPYAIAWKDVLYLFYVKVVSGGYRIYAARSSDGLAFTPLSSGPVLEVGGQGQWDSYTVTTPKVFADGDRFVMLYAGDNRSLDDPTGIGIAVSDDLVRWRKHPGNPILRPGARGEFDSLSVGSAVPFQADGRWHILYAGTSRPLSEGLQSQIGVARLAGPDQR
jgi:predicted GH43/DUF377 family glycosyl hydrolase